MGGYKQFSSQRIFITATNLVFWSDRAAQVKKKLRFQIGTGDKIVVELNNDSMCVALIKLTHDIQVFIFSPFFSCATLGGIWIWTKFSPTGPEKSTEDMQGE